MSLNYTPPPAVKDGDTAYAKDVNGINEETDAAFTLVEAELASFSDLVEMWATLAQKWAENPEDVEVEAGAYSALHWATKGADSAVAASASEVAAAQSEVIATEQAAISVASADYAEDRAISAAYSASNADTSYATFLKYQF